MWQLICKREASKARILRAVIKRTYVFMSEAQRNRWTKQLFRGGTRYADEVTSKLAEDSHKGINRRRHKSDRRGSVRKLSAWWRQRGGDAAERIRAFWWASSVMLHEGTSLITPADSRGIVNSRKLSVNLAIESRISLVRNYITYALFVRPTVNDREFVIRQKLDYTSCVPWHEQH